MTTTDNVIETIPGLLAMGIMANVAGKVIGKNKPIKIRRTKKTLKKIKW